MDTGRGRTALLAVITLTAALATGEPDPKPILVNYFGVPASQFPPEAYRYDPRANNYGRYTQSSTGYPTFDRGGGGYLVADPQRGTEYQVAAEYPVVDPRVTDRYQHGDGHGEGGTYVNPPAVTVRPLQHNNRDAAANYEHRGIAGTAAPHYDSSYNGIVRKAGVAEDGKDYRGEPGIYAMRGGVFPAVDYERPEQHVGSYYFQPTNFYPIPTHIAPNGDFYGNFRAHGPYVLNAARPRPLGYSPQIHARGDENNPSAKEREQHISNGREGDDDNYEANIKGRYDDRQVGKEEHGFRPQPAFAPHQNPGYVGYRQQEFTGNQQRGQLDNQQRDYPDNQQRGQLDNQQRDYLDNQQRGYPGNQQRGHLDNQQRDYPDNQQHGYPGNQQRDYPGNQQHGYPGNQQHGPYQQLGHVGNQHPNYIGHQQLGYAVNQQMRYPDSQRPEFVVQRQGVRDGHRDDQIPNKIPVRGVNSKAPQVFYPTEKDGAANDRGGRQHN